MTGPFALCACGDDSIVRIGVGVTSARDAADIQYAVLEEFTLAQQLEVLRWWGEVEGQWCMSEPVLRDHLRLAGVLGPEP